MESFKQESKLGGYYPPSTSDDTSGSFTIGNPFSTSPATLNNTSGANLLVYALRGADGLGTPRLLRSRVSATPVGMMIWVATIRLRPPVLMQRYKPATRRASPCCRATGLTSEGNAINDSLTKVADLDLANWNDMTSEGWTADDQNHLVFVDNFDLPILYYKARRSAPVDGAHDGHAGRHL